LFLIIHIKAISNLGRAEDGSYFETQNYAITESHEPGSTFKLVDLIAVLDDKKADTGTVYNSFEGEIQYYKDIMGRRKETDVEGAGVRSYYDDFLFFSWTGNKKDGFTPSGI
jgi:cell division protein FtsI/penicillin-binding protein 2